MCVEPPYGALMGFMRLHGVKGGGFLSKDKTDEIVLYYPRAGYGLRVVETRGY